MCRRATAGVTAEYSMLPRANRERSRRDVDKLKLSGAVRKFSVL